ncbi:D-tyrosyl-tRNA(Tyr) deacylase [bacterium]|nr:MAG: D-tyrosyl-tRNA(Tyr) deacylase [bacterium]
MRAVVQRVSMANVMVDGKEVGRCGPGLLLLVGIEVDDEESDAIWLAKKVARLRIFNDAAGKLNESVLDRPDERDVLAISNFTLYGDSAKGSRPSFARSMPAERAISFFSLFVGYLKSEGVSVQTGVFGADMRVSLVNDGPVTLILDSP